LDGGCIRPPPPHSLSIGVPVATNPFCHSRRCRTAVRQRLHRPHPPPMCCSRTRATKRRPNPPPAPSLPPPPRLPPPPTVLRPKLRRIRHPSRLNHILVGRNRKWLRLLCRSPCLSAWRAARCALFVAVVTLLPRCQSCHRGACISRHIYPCDTHAPTPSLAVRCELPRGDTPLAGTPRHERSAQAAQRRAACKQGGTTPYTVGGHS
jgi:hypothetical protein